MKKIILSLIALMLTGITFANDLGISVKEGSGDKKEDQKSILFYRRFWFKDKGQISKHFKKK